MGSGSPLNGRRPRLLDATFTAVLAVSLGVAFPVLSAFGFNGWPPSVHPRWRHLEATASNLGFPWQSEAITPAMRQADGFGDLMGVALALGLVVLGVGCATLATLVLRRGWHVRDELTVHTAHGATRADLVRLVMGRWSWLLGAGTAAGLALGLGLDAWLRAIAPEVVLPPSSRLSGAALLAVLAPAATTLVAASIEAGRAIRRLRAPLDPSPVSRLVQLGIGAVYLGALVALLSTTAVLLRGSASPEGGGPGWQEARDTLVIDFQAATPDALTSTLSLLNSSGDAERRPEAALPSEPMPPATDGLWHLVSAGALEDLGVADVILFECHCSFGLIPAPVVRVLTQHHSVSPGVFEAMGVPVLEGREFDEGDGPGAPLVVVVDRSLVSRLRVADPVGLVMRIGPRLAGPGDWYRVIGVIDVPEGRGLEGGDAALGGIYLSSLQHPPSAAQLLVRADDTDERAVIATLAALAPDASIGAVRPLADRLAAWAAPMRWFSVLATLLALVVAGVGLFGLGASIALEVRARIPELGVHRAMGARRAHLRRIVLSDVGRVAVWGGALGLIAAPGLVRGLADRFPTLDALDAPTSGGILAILILALLLGSAGPLRRAARITPIEAMGSTE